MVIPYLYSVEVWAEGFFKPLGRRGDKWVQNRRRKLIQSVSLLGRIKYHRTTFSVSKLSEEISRTCLIFYGGYYHQ